MKILVTGAAGFIGARVAELLLARGDQVVGLDNMNDYYEVSLKEARLARLTPSQGFVFERLDAADRDAIPAMFARHRPQRVIHLAAQAGVRYSIDHPHEYIDSNIVGFVNILEGCRHNEVEHLVYASSSSVYGANTRQPFSVHHNVDHPVSLYAATKKANELVAHSYSHLYQIPTTGLRFFTVYGPWGRPDMSMFLFAKNILQGKPIDVFNFGNHRRDFTYIDDIANGVLACVDQIAQPDEQWSGDQPNPSSSKAPYRLYNIGCHRPVELLEFIEILENCLGRKAEKNFLPLQPGDVPDTFADIQDLVDAVDYHPVTPVEQGIAMFTEWYRDYYQI
jgi:UDP-glucuronate 4-epimerase